MAVLVAVMPVEAAIRPASAVSDGRVRGLGWDAAQPSLERAPLPTGSFGHTGYTGTMIWVDPASGAYVIILTNRTYPDGRGDAQPLRNEILQAVFSGSGG